MSLSTYVVGVLLTAVVVLAAGAVGMAGRRVLMPTSRAATGALVVLVVAVSFLVVVGELLGTVGLFSRVPLVVVSVVFGAAAITWLRPKPSEWTFPRLGRPSLAQAAAMLCGGLVLAQAAMSVRATMSTGNMFIDSTEYHLTWAAHFATSHRTGGIIQVGPSASPTYYPLNDELLHAWGMALFHRDVLSLLLGVVDVGAVLLAAWSVGEAFGVGALTMCAVCPLLATLGGYVASGINDWSALWPLLALLAFMRPGERDQTSVAKRSILVGLAAGLALGAKVSVLFAVVVLVVGYVLLTPRGVRARGAVIACAAAVVTGGYWYVRDIVAVGSPLPTTHIPGLPYVPIPEISPQSYTVAHYLGNLHIIRHYYLPGLHFLFGVGWAGDLLVVVIGVVLALARGSKLDRVLAIAAIVAAAMYLVTPTGAFGPAGMPVLFKYNLRYAFPALALGLVLFTGLRMSDRVRKVALAAVVVLTLLAVARRAVWAIPTNRDIAIYALGTVVVVAAARLLVTMPRQVVLPVTAVVVLAALLAGFHESRVYSAERYAGKGGASGELYASLQKVHGARIGVVGVPSVYPFLGPTFSNTARYVGDERSDHAFIDYRSCQSWRAAVSRGGYNYIVVEGPHGIAAPPALAWTSSDPGAESLLSTAAGEVFSIRPGFGQAPCPA